MENRAGDYPPGEFDRRVSYLVVREGGRSPIVLQCRREGRTITSVPSPPRDPMYTL